MPLGEKQIQKLIDVHRRTTSEILSPREAGKMAERLIRLVDLLNCGRSGPAFRSGGQPMSDGEIDLLSKKH